ncbi:uncharacterized protein IL334_005525 [Kwoniella shivajii]|uniref:Uncharacterized protein n=1 Tax=Kwoniella shivajii TaxID=564305 RepID=A0ABZ1D421_9TREE|nr:hypothetical protein IL334_005525 [Kwoniella shivajii]
MLFPILSASFLASSALAIPVPPPSDSKFNLGIPLHTSYINGSNSADIRPGDITVIMEFTASEIGQGIKKDFHWITYEHDDTAKSDEITPIWNMTCFAIAKKAFEGPAEFTLQDHSPWITAGVNASGVQDGSAGISCPTGSCLSDECKGKELPLIDTFLHYYI